MAKGNKQKLSVSENYLSLALGVLVAIVMGALVLNFINHRAPQKNEKALTTEGQSTEEQKAAPSLPTKHKVTQNEDLWKIAEHYYKSGYNWVDIARANPNLTNPDVILADTELTIPAAESKTSTVTDLAISKGGAKASVVAAASSVAITGDTYTVAQGDDLWDVAVRAYGDGYKWTEIAKANNLENPDLIYSGNTLKLPR